MQYVIGFVIALFIALTGVGAGTITVPVLVLFLGVPAPVAVGIGLMFATCGEADSGAGANCSPQRGLADSCLYARRRCAGRDHRIAVPEAPGQCRITKPAERDIGHNSGGDGKLADSCLLSGHSSRTPASEIAALCSGGLCCRWALRLVFLQPERALLALPRC